MIDSVRPAGKWQIVDHAKQAETVACLNPIIGGECSDCGGRAFVSEHTVHPWTCKSLGFIYLFIHSPYKIDKLLQRIMHTFLGNISDSLWADFYTSELNTLQTVHYLEKDNMQISFVEVVEKCFMIYSSTMQNELMNGFFHVSTLRSNHIFCVVKSSSLNPRHSVMLRSEFCAAHVHWRLLVWGGCAAVEGF